MHCELLEACGFFKKYQDSINLACRVFLDTYCLGPKMNECKRKEYREKFGSPPPEDMLPTGYSMTRRNPRHDFFNS